jgi:RraA family protein
MLPYNSHKLCGPAFTVKVPIGDNLVAQMALDYVQEGDILVIDGGANCDRALFGGMMLAYAQLKKLGGIVVNGAIRDIEDIRKGSMAVYALGQTPQGPYRHGPGEINVPVVCGGQVVMPGDILVGDEDGLVVIPKRAASSVLKLAQQNVEGEQKELHAMNSGAYNFETHVETFTGSFLAKGGILSKNDEINIILDT